MSFSLVIQFAADAQGRIAPTDLKQALEAADASYGPNQYAIGVDVKEEPPVTADSDAIDETMEHDFNTDPDDIEQEFDPVKTVIFTIYPKSR